MKSHLITQRWCSDRHWPRGEIACYVEDVRVRCPTCGRKDEVSEDFEYRPFCSRRCKMIDLGNWLDEVYRFSRPLDVEDLDERALSSLSFGPLQYLRTH